MPSERGFALTEVLAAAAIAAAVVAASSATLASTVRAAARSGTIYEQGLSLRNAEAMLRAGVPAAQVRLAHPAVELVSAPDPASQNGWLPPGALAAWSLTSTSGETLTVWVESHD
ncbi:prepilin-type N-terminal cleavage/methylation domain-containing protein [Parvularcula oceani]|uniref:prepilin-type N-terminal cleavage/methylation domain-containing protein n=1 Tax=Parvularcula oceani TaxID=1247963 RepID=UPI0004E1EF7B|nr:prepilin-type N-terminal cleavage/methylation domain-containing protein [Parvularcula oceani]